MNKEDISKEILEDVKKRCEEDRFKELFFESKEIKPVGMIDINKELANNLKKIAKRLLIK